MSNKASGMPKKTFIALHCDERKRNSTKEVLRLTSSREIYRVVRLFNVRRSGLSLSIGKRLNDKIELVIELQGEQAETFVR